MNGTTLCPFCNTRFKIAGSQLEAYCGMVRCGHCMQAFDARSSYIPDQLVAARPESGALHVADKFVARALDEAIVRHGQGDRLSTPKYRRWQHGVIAAFLLLLLAQATFFFRIDLAARLPYLKPVLTGACQLLGCSVPLPQRTDLMSIESSDIEAEPLLENHIILNALLRNRATYAQALPNLELTLNDTQDKPLARRIFKPKDYLPPLESEQTGLLPNHELSLKLLLDTADLKPSGYRLVLFYARR